MLGLDTCTWDSPCEIMTIGAAIDWVTWLVCNLQIRNQSFMISSKIENDVTKDFGKFHGLIMYLI